MFHVLTQWNGRIRKFFVILISFIIFKYISQNFKANEKGSSKSFVSHYVQCTLCFLDVTAL